MTEPAVGKEWFYTVRELLKHPDKRGRSEHVRWSKNLIQQLVLFNTKNAVSASIGKSEANVTNKKTALSSVVASPECGSMGGTGLEPVTPCL